MDIFRISARSVPPLVAGAVAHHFRESPSSSLLSLRAVGAGAVNQAIKAIICANRYLSDEALALDTQFHLVDISINGHDVTAIDFILSLKEVFNNANV